MTVSNQFLFIFSFLVLTFTASPAAYADCSDPAGKAGTMDYFTSDGVYKFCDGTDWHSMKGGAASGEDVATKDYVDTAVAAGGGAGSLTAWGTTTCPSGWSTAYTGQAATIGKTEFNNTPYPAAFSSIICIAGGLSWSATGNNRSKTLWWNGNNEQYAQALVSCAVCVK